MHTAQSQTAVGHVVDSPLPVAVRAQDYAAVQLMPSTLRFLLSKLHTRSWWGHQAAL